MRWRYFSEGNPDEAAVHADVLQKIDCWWETFATKTQALDDLFKRRDKWDLPAWMQEHLQGIHPDLMWEFGPSLNGVGHRLVITPEQNTHLRGMVQTLLQRAPKLDGWEFLPYRPPENLEMAIQTVEVRAHGDLREAMVSVAVGKHNRIDLCYFSPTTTGGDDKQASHSALVATETLLGEEVFDQWVGSIDVAPLPKPSGIGKLLGRGRKPDPRLLPLERLKPVVSALIASMTEQRPAEPLYSDESVYESPSGEPIGAVFKLEPEVADDYPQWSDLFVASAADQPLWLALHSGVPFYSARYSRHGEQFCYLKLDGSQRLDKEKFADRASIEDAIDEILVAARLGCVIGGGTGRRYSYIDLALTDVDASIPLISTCLRAGNIPNRTWLLFFDASLGNEWIGIYDDTPPPPGIVETG